MLGKLAVLLAIVATGTLSANDALAESKKFVVIEDLSYTVIQDVPWASDMGLTGKTDFVVAGVGTLDCNGVELCMDKDLEGHKVKFLQTFRVEIDGVDAGQFGELSSTGLLLLGKGLPTITFKGDGEATGSCVDGACEFTAKVEAVGEGGVRIDFTLSIHIDHTSAGIFVEEIFGSAHAWHIERFDFPTL